MKSRVLTLLVVLAACQTPAPSGSNTPETPDAPDTPTTTTPQPTNRAPVFTAAVTSITVDENAEASVTVTVSDADNDGVTVTATTQPTHGVLVIMQSGQNVTLTYTPAPGYTGADTFTLQASDGKGGVVSVTVSITVAAAQTATLTPADDDVTATENGVSTFAVSTLLGNDMGQAPLSIVGVTGGADGVMLTLDGDNVSYDPGATFDGLAHNATATDKIYYIVRDALGAEATVTVNITITGTNDAPVLANTSLSSSCTPRETVGVTLSATDVDGDSVTYSVTGGDCPTGLQIGPSGVIGECPAVGTACTAVVAASDGTSSVTGSVSIGANVVFVAEGGTGPGTSWDQAAGTFAAAIAAATPTGHAFTRDIWAARGTYRSVAGAPVIDLDGSSGGTYSHGFFFGGFAGNEHYLSLRQSAGVLDPSSVLDGDLGANGLGGVTGPDNGDSETVVHVRYVADVHFDGFVIQNGEANDNGNAAGANVADSSFVFFDNVVFANNRAYASDNAVFPVDGTGGALHVLNAQVSLNNCLFSNNLAQGSKGNDSVGGGLARGGAIFAGSQASLTVTDCWFWANAAVGGDGAPAGGGQGGAISATSATRVTIERSHFTTNSAVGGGGAPALDAQDTSANGGKAFGGAIALDITPAFTIEDSTFSGNEALGGMGGGGANGDTTLGGAAGIGGLAAGGALWSNRSDGTVHSIFRANNAYGGRGGDGGVGGANGDQGQAGGPGGRGGAGYGGAIAADGASVADVALAIVNSTFFVNGARGGDGGAGGAGYSFVGLMVIPVGAAAGPGGDGGDAGPSVGAALWVSDRRASLLFTSVVNNTALTAAPGAGGLGGEELSPPSTRAADGAVGQAANDGAAIETTAAPSGAIAIDSSALGANDPDTLTFDGLVTLERTCARFDPSTVAGPGGGNVQISSNETFDQFGPAESGQLFLDVSWNNACLDLGAGNAFGERTTLRGQSADTGAPDAAAGYSPTGAIILSSRNAGEVMDTNLYAGDCTQISVSPYRFTTFNAVDPRPSAVGAPLLIRCQASSVELALP